jgi:SAM-dependent methyltransferase
VPEPPASLDELLAGQLRYYRERASTYTETALVSIDDDDYRRLMAGVDEAFDRHVHGDILELACGPGTWTAMLAERARHVTAVDGAPEMLELAGAQQPGDNVEFHRADLFSWRPDGRYDAVFFGFWLSHVPAARFEPFWAKVGEALAPGGRVLLVDDAYRTDDELIYGATSELIHRRGDRGGRHLIVKVAQTAAELSERLARIGWRSELQEAGPFLWGVGEPA